VRAIARQLFSKITDPIFLAYELIISNRRLIFPTIVGLIIALTVISNTSLLIESYQQRIFEETVFSDDSYSKYYGDISVNLYGWDMSPREDFNLGWFTDFTRYNNYISNSIQIANYTDYISYYFWYSQFECAMWVNATEPHYGGLLEQRTNIYASSATEFYSQLETILENEGEGRLPANSSELLLIRPKGESRFEWEQEEEKIFENLTLNAKINLTMMSRDIGYQETQINKTYTIVGVIRCERHVRSPYREGVYSPSTDDTNELLRRYIHYILEQYSFFTRQNLLSQIMKELTAFYSQIDLDCRIEGKIFLDRTQFNAYNVNSEIKKLKRFVQALEGELYEVSYNPYIYSHILWKMEEYQYTILGLIIILLLVSFPVLAIALYLVVYSFGLIRKQKQEQIGIIKTRGGSWFQILLILLGELVVSTIFAVIIGFILSIFLADIVMRSTDYLEFLGVQVPVQVSVGMFQTLLIWGIVFALLLNFMKIIRMSRQKITETLVPIEIRDPFWKRYYIDVIFFVVGTSIWLIFMTLTRSMVIDDEEREPMFYVLYIVFTLLGIPAPFLMFFGTIMVIARTFPFLMRKLSVLFWQIEGGIAAFSIRNIVRHKQAANRAVLLITLALSFSILSSSLIFSLDETQRLNYYYSEGADLTLSEENFLNESFLPLLQENVSHLTSVSTAYLAEYHSYGYIGREYSFLFVDPATYAQTAFNEPQFKLSSSLSSLMTQLTDNSTILLFEGNLKSDIAKPKIGENLTLYFSNDTGPTTEYSLRVGGTFKYWPMLYPRSWYDFSHHYWIIGSLGLFEQLNQSLFLSDITGKYLVKVDSVNNIEETIERVYNVTGVMPLSPALRYREYKSSFGRIFSLSILNSDLIVCIVIAVVGIIMFAFFTYVERGKEIGVERALGMTRLQTALSFLVEATLIIAFGIFIGIITGMYFVTMFLQITQFGETVPPSVVTYPITLLIQMLLGILIAAGIGTVAPAYMASRKDISRILKVE
jgi:ABC-type antimicrobial peptide transport system permease subunit